MAKITLAKPLSGYNLTAINDNFTLIEQEFQNKVLYRNNTSGEANQLETDVDANSKRILNLPEPLTNNEAARLVDVQNGIAGAAANLISYTPTGTVAATNVQAAINEVDSEKMAISTLAASGGSALVGYLPDGAGAVATTVQSKLQESVSVLDFYANGVSGVRVDPTGVVDSTLGIQAAIDAVTPTLPGNPWDLNGTAGGTVYIPAGSYKVSATLFIPAWVNVIGAGKAATQLIASGNPGTIVSMGRPGLAPANDPLQSFHCSISRLSIFGSSLNTNGLAIYASFWMMFDVEVSRCNLDGIYLKTTYSGKAYNTYVFYCATASGYAGIKMDGVSAGLGANDVSFFGGSIGNCYDSVRIEQCNGAYFSNMSVQSSKRHGYNLQPGAVGITIRDGYFESNAEQVAGNTIFGTLSFLLLDNNYFAGMGLFESKYVAGSSFNGVKITNNLFGSAGATNLIGLVDEAAVSCSFIRNLILGNSGENDSVLLFTPALKVFVDAALYAVNTAALNRVDHLTQYSFQVDARKTYTATITPSTSGTITLDTSADTVSYTQIGKLVHVQGRLLVASVASPVGTNVRLSLPLPIASLPETSGKIAGVIIDTSVTARPFTGDETNSYVNVFLTAASITAGMYYGFSFSYFTA